MDWTSCSEIVRKMKNGKYLLFGVILLFCPLWIIYIGDGDTGLYKKEENDEWSEVNTAYPC